MSWKVLKYLAILFLKLWWLILPGHLNSWQILNKFSSAVHGSKWHSSLCCSSYTSCFTCLKSWVWAAVGPLSAVKAWGKMSTVLPFSLSASHWQLFQLLFLQEWEWEAVSIGQELLVLQGVLSSPAWAQTSKQFMLLLSFHLTGSKGLKTDVCHMALKMLSHPSLVTSGLKIQVITAINHYSISPEESSTLTFLYQVLNNSIFLPVPVEGFYCVLVSQRLEFLFGEKTLTIKPKLHYDKYKWVQF